MMSDTNIYIVSFSVYFIVLLTLGYFAFKKTQSLSDYLLGGRSLGCWVSALSAGASDMSGWLLLGLPGYAYLSGLESIWIAVGLFIGASLNWIIVAPKLRVQTEQANNALTLPEFFEHRFQDNTHSIRLISACFILLFYVFYTSAGLVAAGKLFESVFALPYQYAVMSGTLIILIYTAIGGFLAVSWTDLFQGLLMFFALLLVVVLAQLNIGSLTEFSQHMTMSNIELLNLWTSNTGKPLTLITIISLLSWGLGYFGQPHILSRFMAIKSMDEIPRARNIAIGWTGLCLIFSILIGLYGIVLLQTPLTSSDSEKILLELLPILFHPVFAGIVLAAVLAAIMSTADSQLLVGASVFTEDIYKTFFGKTATEKQLIQLGRISVIIMAAIACLLALNPDNKVLDLVAYAWAGFGAAFGPLVITMLHRRVSKTAAIAGILSGGLTVVIWKQLEGGIFDLYELFPAFILSFLLIFLITNLNIK